MKPKIAYHYLLVIICLTLSSHSHAQADTKMIIDVTTAGTLSNLLGNKADSVKDLTLFGKLNGTDIKTIRNMDSLSVLNLADATIVSGGEAYYSIYVQEPMGGSHTVFFNTSNDVLGSWFFYNCTRLTSVTLPNSINAISYWALSNCSKLTSINIPNGVLSIRNNAFNGCSMLTSVSLSGSLKAIESGTFSNCSRLTSITMPSSVLSIDPTAFINCKGLTQYLVEVGNPNYSSSDGVLFGKDKKTLILYPEGKKNLEYFIPEGVVTIGSNAFSHCKVVTLINIPKSVTTLNNNAFYDCSNLSAIHCNALIPPSVGTSVFEGVNKSSCKLFVPKASYNAYKTNSGWSEFTNIIIDEGIYSLKFSFNVIEPGTLSTLLGNKVDSIRDLTLTGFLNGTDIGTIRSMDSLSILNLYEANIVSGGNAYYSNSTYYNTTNDAIGDYAFYGCKRLTSIYLPKTVTSIGDQAFDVGISHIHSKSLTPPTVKLTTFNAINKSICKIYVRIAAYAVYPSTTGWSDFNQYILEDNSVYSQPLTMNIATAGSLSTFLGNCCDLVSNLTLTGYLNGNDINTIRTMWLLSNLNLSDANIVSGGSYQVFSTTYYTANNTISDKAFCFSTNLKTITLPKNITSIGKNAFYVCTALTSVIIPGGVTSIGESSFQDCSALTSMALPNTVNIIGKDAFNGCKFLTSINIPDGVTTIGDRTFNSCLRLKAITLPKSLTSIGYSAFSHCESLDTITIPEGVVTLDDFAFNACFRLAEIHCNSTTPPSLTSSTFDYVNKSTCKIYVPKGTVETYHTTYGWKDFLKIIDEGTNFYQKISLNVAEAGTLSTLLGNNADYIGDLTLTGSLNGSDFKTIRKMANLTILNIADATIVSGGGCYWPFENSLYYTTNNVIGFALFSNLSNITSLTLPKNIVSIREDAFYGCNKLTAITIPDGVTSIDAHAFYNCTGLDSISIPENVVSIGNAVFGYCSGLRVITIPNNNLLIGEKAFERCTGLKKIYCKAMVPPTIDLYTFDYLEKSQCTLYVPEGTFQSYRSAWGWQEFPNVTDGIHSSVNNQKVSDIQVYVDNNSIILNGANSGNEVSVYSTSGTLVFRKKATESTVRIEMPVNNLYLVKIANKTFKVAL